MRITFPLIGLGGSGGEKGIVRIANILIERGHDVIFVLPWRSNTNIYRTSAKIIFTPPVFSYFRGFRLKYIDVFLIYLFLTFRIPKSDIICANSCLTAYPTIIASNLLKRGIPFYYVQHDETLFFNQRTDLWYIKHVRSTYCRFDNIITISKWLYNRIFDYSGKKAKIVHPAIDRDVFYPIMNSGIRNDPRMVLCIGVEYEWKGNIDIFKAMQIIFMKNKNVKLFIVGRKKLHINFDFPYEEISANDEELAELYRKCDVYVLASWYEGFPAPPLEAMACGAPVVSTDNLGIREYGIHEHNCLIVPPNNPEKLAEGILRLLSDEELADKLRNEGPITASHFSWVRTAELFESLFKEAINVRK
jgi:glycosyltransferase involved in cell wall biosynthesis